MESRMEGEYILVSKTNPGRFLLEYTPFLTHITEETEDDFELELDDELTSILPYGVACDLFKTDPGEDYRAFEKEYERRLQLIKTSRTSLSANVTEGVL